jgi:hypothetical protein
MEYFLLILVAFGLMLLINKVAALLPNLIRKPDFRVYSREFTISRQHPKDQYENVEYISVNKDGSATVKTLHSNETLTAHKNQFFKGTDYGVQGLQLLSTSYDDQEILLKRYAPGDLDDE